MENVTLTQKEQARLQVLNSLLTEHMTLDQAATFHLGFGLVGEVVAAVLFFVRAPRPADPVSDVGNLALGPLPESDCLIGNEFPGRATTFRVRSNAATAPATAPASRPGRTPPLFRISFPPQMFLSVRSSRLF